MKKISNICHQGEVTITNFLVMFVGIEFTREALELEIACSRLSDSGEDAKVKGTRSFFHVRAFLIPADSGADLGGGCRGCASPPPPEMTSGFLIQLVYCRKKNYVVYWC